ncbi:phosphotransferase [Candidatus Omnitrophota bacterium]
METLYSNNMICRLCPNGCHLTLVEKDPRQIEIKGNRCVKGKSFVKRELMDCGMNVDSLDVVSYEKEDPFSFDELARIVSHWGFELKKILPKIFIEGSPERTEYRVVVEDKDGQWFALEQVTPASLNKKKRIINVLHLLDQRHLPYIKPYLFDAAGRSIVDCDLGLWQLSPFIRGVALNREQYLYEGWRAPLLADFLLRLRKKSTGIPGFEEESFSLKEYVYHLVHQIHKHQGPLVAPINAVLAFCEDTLFRAYDQIPTCFCHGDFHALNIIWGHRQIKAVIDWEFCGFKPEIYDVGNMVGCLGVEHPSSLKGDLVVDFITMLKEQSDISDHSWKLLVDFIVALRFAWLSEWLRKEDTEMITLELDYMNLLIENKQALLELWNIN